VLGTFQIHFLLSIFIVVALIILLYLRHVFIKRRGLEESNNNYNDLLKDYVLKLDTIRRLNIFDYCVKKLEDNKDNDICFLKNKDVSNNLLFSNGIFTLISIIFIVTIFLIDSSVTILGYIIFFIIIMIKLEGLLHEINPLINNIFNARRNRQILDSCFDDLEEYSYVKTWKKINIKDGICSYLDSKV
jgi:ABC-type bacteriocin/lantibiotic exporter with double-glycine peptidase domain